MNKCKQCGKEFDKKGSFCSSFCNEKYYQFHAKPNCKCVVCGILMYMRPSRIKNHKHGVTCSLKCSSIFRSKWFTGESNHQFGKKGNLNDSFKSERLLNKFGYVTLCIPSHPFCKKSRVFEHRVVVENNSAMFDSKYFIEIDGVKYLKPEVEVHHKNEIKTDNRIENLMPVTKSEHRAIHNNGKSIIRDDKGRIIGLKKVC